MSTKLYNTELTDELRRLDLDRANHMEVIELLKARLNFPKKHTSTPPPEITNDDQPLVRLMLSHIEVMEQYVVKNYSIKSLAALHQMQEYEVKQVISWFRSMIHKATKASSRTLRN